MDAPRTHATGERFVVGEGDDAFGYTVHRVRTADRLGVYEGVAADGVFLVVEMTVENLTSSRGGVPIETMSLRGGVVRNVNGDMTNRAEQDDRIDSESLADVLTFPDQSIRGFIVFDTEDDPANDHYLRIEPPGVEDESGFHRVPLGTFEEIPALE